MGEIESLRLYWFLVSIFCCLGVSLVIMKKFFNGTLLGNWKLKRKEKRIRREKVRPTCNLLLEGCGLGRWNFEGSNILVIN